MLFYSAFVQQLWQHSQQNSQALHNKTALVVGGTQGIGQGSALGFARLGASVVFTGRNRALAEQVLKELKQVNPSAEHSFVALDVTSIDDVDRFCVDMEKKYRQSGLHVVCLCTGGPSVNYSFEPTQDGVDRVLHVNVLGRLQILERLGPLLNKSNGRVINILSPGYQSNVDWSKALDWKQKSTVGLERLAVGAICHDLYGKSFSDRFPSAAYIHMFPKIVATHSLSNSGAPALLGWLGATALSFLSYLHVGVLSKEECGLAVARMAVDARYNTGCHFVNVESERISPHPQSNSPTVCEQVTAYVRSLIDKKL